MGLNITPDALLRGVIAYTNTPEGKERAEKAIKAKFGASAGSIGTCPVEISDIVSDLLYIIDLELGVYTPFVNSSDISVSSPIRLPNGTWLVELNFKPEAVRRESLLGGDDGNTRTGDGIDNIVALFNTGYEASDYTYGWWDGHTSSYGVRSTSSSSWVRSRKSRLPLLFMERAIETFNIKYSKRDIRAILGDSFKNRKT